MNNDEDDTDRVEYEIDREQYEEYLKEQKDLVWLDTPSTIFIQRNIFTIKHGG